MSLPAPSSAAPPSSLSAFFPALSPLLTKKEDIGVAMIGGAGRVTGRGRGRAIGTAPGTAPGKPVGTAPGTAMGAKGGMLGVGKSPGFMLGVGKSAGVGKSPGLTGWDVLSTVGAGRMIGGALGVGKEGAAAEVDADWLSSHLKRTKSGVVIH